MGHLTARDGYRSLVERLNRLPQGAPPSDLLFKILGLLLSEKEAGLVAALPIRPFTAAKAARIWKKPVLEARKILETLAGRGLLIDSEKDGAERLFPPPSDGRIF